MYIVLGVSNEQIHLLTLEHRRASASQVLFEDGDLEAVVSQADRKQLHRALRFESRLNGRPSMVR
jgi:hypothetical protein